MSPSSLKDSETVDSSNELVPVTGAESTVLTIEDMAFSRDVFGPFDLRGPEDGFPRRPPAPPLLFGPEFERPRLGRLESLLFFVSVTKWLLLR